MRDRTNARYVVIAPQGLGDTLEITPMLEVLRAAEPAAHVEAVVLRIAARDLLQDLPRLVDRVTYLPYWERGAGAFASAALPLPMRPRVDAVFLAYPAARPVYLALTVIVNARRRYAHRYDARPLRRIADAAIEQIEIRNVHNVLRNVDLLRAHGIDGPVGERYSVPESWRTDVVRERRRIAMHVGTIAHDGLEARRWPADRFAELGRRLVARGYALDLLAGPAERELTERVALAVPGSRLVARPLVDVARHIGSATLVVANDSGVAHLAAGVGTPVLALFGPTPTEHGPYSPDAVVFRPSPCPPCFDIVRTDSTCKLAIDYRCLKADLPVDLVEARLLAMLENPTSR